MTSRGARLAGIEIGIGFIALLLRSESWLHGQARVSQPTKFMINAHR